jgi:hypothetical protein
MTGELGRPNLRWLVALACVVGLTAQAGCCTLMPGTRTVECSRGDKEIENCCELRGFDFSLLDLSKGERPYGCIFIVEDGCTFEDFGDCEVAAAQACSSYDGPYGGGDYARHAEARKHGLLRYLVPSRDDLAARGAPAGSIVLTPVADGTVQQLVQDVNLPGFRTFVATTGPATLGSSRPGEGGPVEVLDRSPLFNFLRYGLATGGARGLTGHTRLEHFADTLPIARSGVFALDEGGFGLAGVAEFDLESLRGALEQLGLSASAVRATLRLTPVRSADLLDLMTPDQASEAPGTTRVAVFDLGTRRKDMRVDYDDFPGFISPRVGGLDSLAGAVAGAPVGRFAIVRTDPFGMLAPVTFDVSDTVRRDLVGGLSSTGFQVASELNGTGVMFADSSMQVPGLSELVAPQLVIELDGLTAPADARFVASATRIPYETLAPGWTDMMLVTITNIGASAGSLAVELGDAAGVFGLTTADGVRLDSETAEATVGPGERVAIGVTFTPVSGRASSAELRLTDTTGGRSEPIGQVALTGAGSRQSMSENLPTITAPIRQMRLPTHAARVGDLNDDGIIDAVDANLLAAVVAGRIDMPQQGTAAFAVTDVDGDGSITAADAVMLGDALAGNLPGLPRSRPSDSPMAGRAAGPDGNERRGA